MNAEMVKALDRHPAAQRPIGAYSTEQLERMNQEFTAAVEHAFRAGGGRRERDGGESNIRLEAPMSGRD